jgi:hypothetical protein
MDALQVDLFNHPQAKLEAQLWAGTTSGLSKYSKLIRDAVSNGDPFPAGSIPVATNPVALTIYNLLCNGTDYFELPRPVLSRSRSFSTSYPTRLVQNAAVTVYSRASLISTFSIPSSVQNQIPPTPATAPPTGEVWAWRLRRQDSTYEPSTRRYSEQMEWDLNSWSTLLYAYVP